MKNVMIIAVVLVVGIVSYEVGRRQGAAHKHIAAVQERPAVKVVEVAQPAQVMTAPIVAQVDPAVPYAQNLTAAQRGYEAAAANVEEALKQIDSLPVSQRKAFVTGIFSFVAKNRSPADALKVYKDAPEAHRANALRALVAEWVYSRSPFEEDMRYSKREAVLAMSGSRVGLEAELTAMLASSKPDAEVAGAWLDAFSQHRSRSEIFSILAGGPGVDNAESLMSRTESWTPWEKERVAKSFLSNWAQGAPQEAWNWYQSNRERFDQNYASNILQPWAYADAEGVKRLLDTLQDPEQRQSAIAAIGKVLAEKNTDQAVSWANSIADSRERELAHGAVYDAAPRGIGAVLDFANGFPSLRGVVPGSPLDGTGARAGDQILEVREANGGTHPLYGRDPREAMNLIRGEPGTQVTLRVLRQNAETGQMEEHLIPVTRGQLYLDEKQMPKPRQG